MLNKLFTILLVLIFSPTISLAARPRVFQLPAGLTAADLAATFRVMDSRPVPGASQVSPYQQRVFQVADAAGNRQYQFIPIRRNQYDIPAQRQYLNVPADAHQAAPGNPDYANVNAFGRLPPGNAFEAAANHGGEYARIQLPAGERIYHVPARGGEPIAVIRGSNQQPEPIYAHPPLIRPAGGEPIYSTPPWTRAASAMDSANRSLAVSQKLFDATSKMPTAPAAGGDVPTRTIQPEIQAEIGNLHEQNLELQREMSKLNRTFGNLTKRLELVENSTLGDEFVERQVSKSITRGLQEDGLSQFEQTADGGVELKRDHSGPVSAEDRANAEVVKQRGKNLRESLKKQMQRRANAAKRNIARSREKITTKMTRHQQRIDQNVERMQELKPKPKPPPLPPRPKR